MLVNNKEQERELAGRGVRVQESAGIQKEGKCENVIKK